MRLNKSFLFLTVFTLLLIPITFISGFHINFTKALEINPYPSFLGFAISENPTLPEYVKYLFNAGMFLGGFLAIIIIAIGGIRYLISYGRGGYTETAKAWIKSGVTGLIILLSSYLIISVINPSISILKLPPLFPVNFGSLGSIIPFGNLSENSYEEIPIGVLTENLLTKTADCHGYDQNGDPIDGDLSTPDIIEPLYINHDRADCIVKLADGAQKKAKIIGNLSNEIKKLMDTCVCDATKCSDTCGGSAGCNQPPTDACPEPADYKCTGACVTSSGCQQSTGSDCCSSGVKDKIEHGDISVSTNIGESSGSCISDALVYKGLDEFRCDPNPISGDFQSCDGGAIVAYVEETQMIDGKETSVIKKANWEKLNLRQQLTYFYYKLNDNGIGKEIQKDLDNLNKARQDLSNCSASDMEQSSVDMMYIQEGTKKDDKTINITKPFADPTTSQTINASKYCNGFEYANSDCFQKCQNACPDSSPNALTCYASCPKCSPTDTSCLATQKTCVDSCFNSRQCIYGASGGNFQNCVTSCQTKCSDTCDKIDPLKCSDEYKFCQSQCNNNSQCVLDNYDKCLLNPGFFQQCGSLSTQIAAAGTQDVGNVKNCVNNSYLCEYGSNQNAGYTDCAKSSSSINCSSYTVYSDCNALYPKCNWDNLNHKCLASGPECNYVDKSGCNTNAHCLWDTGVDKCRLRVCADFSIDESDCLDATTDTCVWVSGTCIPARSTASSSFDSSYFYSDRILNGGKGQKCINPYIPASSSDICFTGSSTSTSPPICINVCPEVTKCPTASNCPDCPCEHINQTLNFSMPQSGSGSGVVVSRTVSIYQMTAPQCANYAYNGDPLTFYCRNNWEPQAPISGQQLTHSLGDEIPIGQAVDGARAWAETTINSSKSITDDIKKILDQMEKTGKAKDTDPIKDYCKCNAQDESAKPVCQVGCQYNETACTCTFTPCDGNSCKQVSDYLVKLIGLTATFKLNFINLYMSSINDSRSDILKQLTYSRKAMSSCSQQSTSLGGSKVRTFSCTKAWVNTYTINEDIGCYGIEDGIEQIPLKDQTDNWFCVKEMAK